MVTDPITLRASELMRLHGLTQERAYVQAAKDFAGLTEHVSVRLSEAQAARARILGNRSVSEGIRAALDAAKLPGE